ncbi:MAG: pyridoxamine 5'-phosphate oxidase family protein [Acidobacteria bacterium]|nr:pyridoxamine 5'-phosphate oxidase family protein [Acidobacteriota bacterium]
MLKRFSEEEALTLLQEGSFGHLGCLTDKGPYVVPLNYIFFEGSIYIHSLQGAKIAALRKHPTVCFQVDKLVSEYQWSSVIAYGCYEEITNPDERYWFMRRILVRFPHLTPVESIAAEGEQSKVVIFRIHIDSVSAVGED